MYAFDPKRHAHTYDGKPLHGVTSVLKYWGDPGALVDWSARMACEYIKGRCAELRDMPTLDPALNLVQIEDALEEAAVAHRKKRDKAGDKGKEVHEQLEVMMNDWINDPQATQLEEYDKIVLTVRDWMFDNGVVPLKSEAHVYSTTHWYGGILDGLVEKDGKKYILDFKTSGSVQTKAFFQMGAYSVAIKEMSPETEISGAVVVHIPRGTSFNPESNVYWFYDVQALEKGFIDILSTYKTDQQLQKIWKR